jgi:hypothetical protein
MVSQTPLNDVAASELPRRDLVAIFAFLNRKGEDPGPARDPYDHAEGVLQQLAAAARMQ